MNKTFYIFSAKYKVFIFLLFITNLNSNGYGKRQNDHVFASVSFIVCKVIYLKLVTNYQP